MFPCDTNNMKNSFKEIETMRKFSVVVNGENFDVTVDEMGAAPAPAAAPAAAPAGA